MINFLQIIAILFGFSLIYFSLLHFRRKEIDASEAYIWTGIWIVTILIVVFPDVIRTFAQEVFVTRLFDLMVVGGFILVITMVYRVYIKIRKFEKKLEKFIREEALKSSKK